MFIQIFQTRKTIRYNPNGKFYYYTFRTGGSIQERVRKTLKEEKTTRLRDKDIQLCSMLIGTTFAFLILCLPTEINDLFSYAGRERSCSNWFRKVILMLMQQIYYAGHFYIYILTGHLFRKHLYAFLIGRRHQNHPPPTEKTLTNFNSQRRSKSSFTTTTSFINPTLHRPLVKFQSNDPCQRLLPDS